MADPRKEQVDKPRSVRKVAGRSLLINVLLTLAKLAAGIAGRSQALVADAIHSLSDSGTDIAIFIGVRFWTRPPDETHPHGHARIETVIGAVIGIVIALTGVALGFRSIRALGDLPAASPGLAALVVAVLSVILKEWLYRWTSRKGKELESSALAANAWHQRTDALSSIPVVAAVSASILNPRWAILDVLGGMVVSVFIVFSAWKILRPALNQLVDTAPPREVVENLQRIAMGVEGVKGVHMIRSRYQGNGIEVDMHVVVDEEIPVAKGFMIVTLVEERIRRSGSGIAGIVVRMEPSAPCGDPDSCSLIGGGVTTNGESGGIER